MYQDCRRKDENEFVLQIIQRCVEMGSRFEVTRNENIASDFLNDIYFMDKSSKIIIYGVFYSKFMIP